MWSVMLVASMLLPSFVAVHLVSWIFGNCFTFDCRSLAISNDLEICVNRVMLDVIFQRYLRKAKNIRNYGIFSNFPDEVKTLHQNVYSEAKVWFTNLRLIPRVGFNSKIMQICLPFVVHLIAHSTKLLIFDWSRAVQLIPNCTS